jgi:hypothetical protein
MPPRDRLRVYSSVAYSMQQPVIGRTAWTCLTAVSITAFSGALLAHVYIGSFGRFVTDDYCTAGILGSHGFFGAQKYWFVTWTGRFSFIMAIDLAHLIGPKIVPLLPTIVLSAWLVVLTWAISRAMVIAYRGRLTMVSLLLAEMIIVSTLATTPSVYQSLYWQTGVLTYVIPIVFATAFTGLLCRIAAADQKPGLALIVLGGFLTFVAAGFSESFAVLEGAALSLALFLSFAADQESLLGTKGRLILFVGLVGAMLGGALVLVAPGNNSRIAEELSGGLTTSPAGTWIALLKLSIHFGLDSIAIACTPRGFVIAIACLPAVLAFTVPAGHEVSSTMMSIVKESSKRFVLGTIIGFTLIACSFVPTAYVTGYLRATYYPPGRLFVIPQFVFYCFICLESYWAGMAARSLRLKVTVGSSSDRRPTSLLWFFGVASLFSIVVAASSARTTWAVEPTVRRFASAWDAQEDKIRAAKMAGLRTVHVERLPATTQNQRLHQYFGLRLMDSLSDDWVNRCVADYYGLDSIVAE